MARLWLLAALVLVLGLGAVALSVGQTRPAPPPGEGQARAALAQAVALARAGDFRGLCALGGGNCQQILDGAGPVPDAPPTIIGSRVVEPTHLPDGNWDVGGRVLAVCGIDGRGQPYQGEVIVFQDGPTLRIIEPVYWSGYAIGTSGSPVTPAGPEPSGGCPAG